MATVYEEMKNPNSCLNKAKTDEPLFVIRAKDELGSLIVRCWAQEAKERSLHEPEKVNEAFALADKMDAWRAANVPAEEPKAQLGGPSLEAPIELPAKEREVRTELVDVTYEELPE